MNKTISPDEVDYFREVWNFEGEQTPSQYGESIIIRKLCNTIELLSRAAACDETLTREQCAVVDEYIVWSTLRVEGSTGE